MSIEREPPGEVVYALGEALDLLAALEDARDALLASAHLTVVMAVEDEIAVVGRKLGFGNPEGDAGDVDGR